MMRSKREDPTTRRALTEYSEAGRLRPRQFDVKAYSGDSTPLFRTLGIPTTSCIQGHWHLYPVPLTFLLDLPVGPSGRAFVLRKLPSARLRVEFERLLVCTCRKRGWHIAPITTSCHLSSITYHLSPITYHLPPTTYHQPPTTYHPPPTTLFACLPLLSIERVHDPETLSSRNAPCRPKSLTHHQLLRLVMP